MKKITYYIDTECKVSDGKMACVVGTVNSFEDEEEMMKYYREEAEMRECNFEEEYEFERIEEPDYVREEVLKW